MDQERLQILKMVEAGQISVEEAAQLLGAIEPGEPDGVEEHGDPLPADAPTGGRWTDFWIYPLMAGGTVLILGAMVVSLVYPSDAARGWLVCGWVPMILGTLIILMAAWSRRARWLHLRIQEEGKRRIALSFPLPLGLAAWVLRIVQPFVPQLKDTGVDELILALRDSATQDAPLFIEVHNGQDGENVELYIG